MREKTEFRNAEEQVVTENMWSIILFILNGIVFLLLGLNIPSSMRETFQNPFINNWLVLGYILAIGIVIMIIRIGWAYCFMWLEYKVIRSKETVKPSFKLAVLTGLTGVRGTVTMAGVLSMPYFVRFFQPQNNFFINIIVLG